MIRHRRTYRRRTDWGNVAAIAFLIACGAAFTALVGALAILPLI